jgi:hypothetical protein
MDHLEKIVRAVVSAGVAPLIAECQSMMARAEAASPPILLDRDARDAVQADRNQWRARAESVITECNELPEKVLRLAKERWPQWR